MFYRPLLAVFILSFLLIQQSAAQAQNTALLSGRAQVVDGDTFAIGTTRVRLQGIDAPETDQICLDAKGERWTYGLTARDKLTEHIGNRACPAPI